MTKAVPEGTAFVRCVCTLLPIALVRSAAPSVKITLKIKDF